MRGLWFTFQTDSREDLTDPDLSEQVFSRVTELIVPSGYL